MKRVLIAICLTLMATSADAGYALYVSSQLPEYVWANGPYGKLEQRKNSEGSVLHPDHFCKPDNYSRFVADVARRTEVIRSNEGTLTPAEVLAVCPNVLEPKYTSLWQKAHDYEQKNISGVGLSILSLGVAQSKPKALAVAYWTQQLWGLYYQCKAQITLEVNPDCNFEAVGSMPHSVPELSTEVWGAP